MTNNLIDIGHLIPLTSEDYPGQRSAVVFCRGCPWRCGYCHQYDLLNSGSEPRIAWADVIKFLASQREALDAVVFSGGEPTRQTHLPAAVRQVKAMGYKVGLHTSGAYPGRLQRLLPDLDWVGMDIKAPFDDYAKVTGTPRSGSRARASVRLVLESGVEHEFRTTVHPALLGHRSIMTIHEELLMLGGHRLRLQDCVISHCLDPALREPPPKPRPH